MDEIDKHQKQIEKAWEQREAEFRKKRKAEVDAEIDKIYSEVKHKRDLGKILGDKFNG